MSKSDNRFILIYANTLYRVESRYKTPYKYHKVAERNRLEITLKHWETYVTALKAAKAIGHNYRGNAPEEIVVMEEREYANRIKGMGEWKTNNITGDGKTKFWVEFDTPACCDPSTETHHCM